MQARRLPRPLPESDSRASDRLQRGRRPKKLCVGRRRHSRHRRLIPRHLGRRCRSILVFSSRFRMSLLFRTIGFFVLSFMPRILFLYSKHAVSVSGRWALHLTTMPSRRTMRLPTPPGWTRHSQRVAREVSEVFPGNWDLRPPRLAIVGQCQEGFLPVANPRVCVVVVFLYMFLEHTIV